MRSLVIGLLMASVATAADAAPDDVANRACAAMVARVTAIPGDGPVFLRSYDGADGSRPNAEPSLANAAFTYDNALAAVALIACGRLPEARRIGEALRSAALADRAGDAGRLRNAYRGGAAATEPLPPAGWWDAQANAWREDAYQVGTATGNVAWAALALLTLNRATGEPRFAEGAERLAHWAVDHTTDNRGPGGFTGGVHGYDGKEVVQPWKSTEHNTDLAAVFDWLATADTKGPWAAEAKRASGFLDAMWSAGNGHFPIGTGLDGVTINRASSGLDAQFWPLLLRGAPAEWRRSLDYAERAHGVDGGFDFNDDRDGVWLEGTAQAALAYRATGQGDKAERLLTLIGGQFSPGGYVWATIKPKITTGLSVGPDSVDADFYYFRWPHLGATAWAALAATGWNPFTGERVR